MGPRTYARGVKVDTAAERHLADQHDDGLAMTGREHRAPPKWSDGNANRRSRERSNTAGASCIWSSVCSWTLVVIAPGAAHAYGYASVVDGAVTGLVIRGRAPLDKLRQLHLHRPLQLTQAGGERPSFSITAGE